MVDYIIETELSIGNVSFLPEFLRRNYLLRHEKYRDFRDVKIKVDDGRQFLSYRVVVPNSSQFVDILVKRDPHYKEVIGNKIFQKLPSA